MTNVTQARAEDMVNALSEAVRALTAEFSLDRILKRLAEIAARLVGARYAALGVPGSEGMAHFFTYGVTEDEISRIEHYPHGLGLLGALLHGKETIRLEDLHKDPRSVGFPEHHPEMTRFLGVPILAKGKNLGTLYLCDRLDGEPFTEEDEHMISLLAAHAAIAIENAKLSEQLRRLAVIEERDRISMELHDGVIQSIYAIGMKLEIARVNSTDDAVRDQIAHVNGDLNRVIEDLRNYIKNLRAGVEFSLTLREQIEEIAERFREVSSARLVIDVGRNLSQINEARLHALIQIIREALSNIVRHAHATEVYLDLQESPTHLTLVISDNGVGFNPKTVTPGIGLRNIRRRAEQIDGTVEMISQPGRGATITVALPIT